ncbi:NYN domain-containing protein [Nocardia sp. NPDC004860]|uniref:NYN domain-containing protein n=1 Tax=Nocardia sp. NPDC004860 TaxID=3154557 RepID=UPI0033B09130
MIIDYQNVHITAHDLYEPYQPVHTSLIRPYFFARRLVQCRNATQRPGYPEAELAQVKVFRGLPSAEHDPDGNARNNAQKNDWDRDPNVKVIQRSLRYNVHRRVYSVPANPDLTGEIEAREKGIDVLCALATISAANDPEIDLVILATHDSDLEPAVEMVQQTKAARIEGFQWFCTNPISGQYTRRLRSTVAPFWATRLYEDDFESVRETRDYR